MMNPADLHTFNYAVSLAQTGQREAAHGMLEQLSWRYPYDVNILLWLAFTTYNLPKARQLVEAATRLEPANPAVINARAWLEEEERRQGTAQSAQTPPWVGTGQAFYSPETGRAAPGYAPWGPPPYSPPPPGPGQYYYPPAAGPIPPGANSNNWAGGGYYPGQMLFAPRLANVGPRFIALLIDTILVNAIAGLLTAGLVSLFGSFSYQSSSYTFGYWWGYNSWWLTSFGTFPLWLLYAWLTFRFMDGYTIGKRLMGLRLVNNDGSPVNQRTYLLHYSVGYFLNGLVLGLGYLWALFNQAHQTWGQKFFNTLTIRD